MKVYPITINIYAADEQEAELARKALGAFVDELGAMSIMVTGAKIAEAVPKWKSPMVRGRIIGHFKS